MAGSDARLCSVRTGRKVPESSVAARRAVVHVELQRRGQEVQDPANRLFRRLFIGEAPAADVAALGGLGRAAMDGYRSQRDVEPGQRLEFEPYLLAGDDLAVRFNGESSCAKVA